MATAAPASAVPAGTPAEDVVAPSRQSQPAGAIPGGLPVQPFSETGGDGDRDNRASDAEQGTDGAPGDDADSGDEASRDADGAGGPGTSLRALSCLEGEGGNEQDGARRGVQKRDFLKKGRFELSGLGGYYASDALSSTYIYGAALSFFPSEDFGVEMMVTRNPVAFRLEEAFTSFDRERHFEGGVAWNFLAAMLWSPVHAKLRWSDRRITHADLLLVAGGGHTAHETVQGMTFQVGGAVKLYLTRFISLRFDVRDLMVPQEVLGRGRSTHNLITLLGLSFWVPG